ncbi:MAG: hypothetical protein NT019_02585 [Candidatus Adlerbacteria bacterium]|nr:hypothetical protein [Candidatus Adlerbacteria bacterium]
MDEKIDRIEKAVERTEKNVSDLTEIVVAIKDYMLTHMATKEELTEELSSVKKELRKDLADVREELGGKIEGVQRSVDGSYERQSLLETRVSKVETELHV